MTPASAAGPATDGTAVADAQAGVDALLDAGSTGDRAAWDARVADVDPAFATRSALLFDNLRSLRAARLDARLTGVSQPLDPARRALLGPDARVLQADLTWRLDGEQADAAATVWLTVVPGPQGVRLASTGDGTTLDTPAEPLWWLAPTTRVDRGGATVLVGEGQDADRWATLAAAATADVRSRLPGPLRDGWDGRVVVEVPGSGNDFTRVLGGSPSAYAGTAAVTRPEGPTTDAAVRVVVDPAAGAGSDTEVGTLLAHETVHVATRSAGSPAPLWVVEGLAELVALAAHPDQRGTEVAALRSAGDDDGDGLPTDAAFGPGGQGVTAAYARAWLACHAIVAHSGSGDLGRLYAALDRGEPLDAAARATLGVDGSTVARWAREAQSEARSRAGSGGG